ncbi:MAG: glycosyl transferase family protein [Novosphingobium sp.]
MWTEAIFANALRCLLAAEGELLLFATFWFIVSAIDEAAIDLSWLWLRLNGHAGAGRVPANLARSPLLGRAAILVPAWHEQEVIGEMVAHLLGAWPQRDFTLYIGCYRNDPATIEAAIAGIGNDTRVRLIVNPREGPTTKADCLNRLYSALREDEIRSGTMYRNVILHDAEDMVHPSALAVMDRALAEVDFVQLPVRPEPQRASPWIAGHYSDEFTEAHAKTMVVRDALGAAIPAAGVGCGFSREALSHLAAMRMAAGASGPFAADCLTEDYELGLLVSRNGGRSRFLRMRDADGSLVATRSFFPPTLDAAVRQKARWIHGIALQGWERLGWRGRPVDIWMALRDRRGPLTAIVLASAYLLLAIEGILAVARLAGWQGEVERSPLLQWMIAIAFASFLWRAFFRFLFTTREYGPVEGLRAVLRIPVANVISIMAARRALKAYIRTLGGAEVSWDKTSHDSHPAAAQQRSVVAGLGA